MDRVNGAGTIDIGAGRRGFLDEDLGVGQEGTEVTAVWLNMVQEEILKVIEATGGVPSESDWTQLAKAIQGQGLNFAATDGSPDDLLLTLPLAPPSYRQGLVVRFLTEAVNTDAMTVNVNGLGGKDLLTRSGAAILPGQVPSNALLDAVYDGTAFRILNVLRATPAMVASGVDPDAMLSPLGLFERKSPFFLASGSALQSIPVGVDTQVTNLADILGSYFNAGSSFAGAQFTCGAKDGGAWLFIGYSALILATASTTGNEYRSAIARNGATGPFNSSFISPSNTYGLISIAPYILNAGDVVDLRVFQNTQTTRNIAATLLFGMRLGGV